jgi:hypothetical protein
MNPEKLMSMTAGKALSFDHIPGGSRPEWTAEEAAMACKGLDQRRFAAFSYRWAHDTSQRSTLYGYLMTEAIAIAVREQWPDRTRKGERYLEKLVNLALWEDLHSIASEISILVSRWPEVAAAFVRDRSAQELRPFFLAAKMEVSVDCWEKELERRYEGIRMVLEGWCSEAHSHMMSRIRDDEAIAA